LLVALDLGHGVGVQPTPSNPKQNLLGGNLY